MSYRAEGEGKERRIVDAAGKLIGTICQGLGICWWGYNADGAEIGRVTVSGRWAHVGRESIAEWLLPETWARYTPKPSRWPW